MIDTRTRDPRRTVDDVFTVVDQAKQAGAGALQFEIGFFQARDLRDQCDRGDGKGSSWRQNPVWTPCMGLHGVDCFVTQLEDRVRLVCRAQDGSLTHFEVDRRASGD